MCFKIFLTAINTNRLSSLEISVLIFHRTALLMLSFLFALFLNMWLLRARSLRIPWITTGHLASGPASLLGLRGALNRRGVHGVADFFAFLIPLTNLPPPFPSTLLLFLNRCLRDCAWVQEAGVDLEGARLLISLELLLAQLLRLTKLSFGSGNSRLQCRTGTPIAHLMLPVNSVSRCLM